MFPGHGKLAVKQNIVYYDFAATFSGCSAKRFSRQTDISLVVVYKFVAITQQNFDVLCCDVF
jgi:hypothetical protein